MTDAEIQKVIKKIMEGNIETMSYMEKMNTFGEETVIERWNNLKKENEILFSFLPKTLTKEEIRQKLKQLNHPSLFEVKSDGQATGFAMKFFKEGNLAVDGNDVSAIVKELRS